MLIEKKVVSALILENNNPEDVAKAMIENGQQKEPFYIFDMDKAFQRIQHFRRMMPRVKIFYAMKSNDTELILKLAAALGVGFDCASPGEIHKILKLNVSPKRIVFALTTKPPEWMWYARHCGVKHATFDTLCELKKIKQFWPEANLLLRIRVQSDSVYDLGKKFGVDSENEAIDLLEEAAALNVKVVGIAFHVGSVCKSIDSYVLGLQQSKKLFEHEAKAGRKLVIIDIGGGYMGDRTDRIDKVSKLINSTLEDLFPDPDVQVISEPGRYICDNSFTLYCSINTVRRKISGDSFIDMLYLNDGVFGTLRHYEPWHTVKRYQERKNNEKLEPKILWGPTCHPYDRVMEHVELMLLPCNTTDWLVFPNLGAYSITMTSRFSALSEPNIRAVISEESWNKIKDCKVFDPNDFCKQNIKEPLPSNLPPIVIQHNPLHSNDNLKS